MSGPSPNFKNIEDRINSNNDLSDIQKKELFKLFYKKVTDVLTEIKSIYDQGSFDNEPMEIVSTANQVQYDSSKDDDLEQATIRHEGTLIVVTKKRSEYPDLISQYLGKTTRLRSLGVDKRKVELSITDQGSIDMESLNIKENKEAEQFISQFKQGVSTCSSSFNKIGQKLDHLVHATEVYERNYAWQVMESNTRQETQDFTARDP